MDRILTRVKRRGNFPTMKDALATLVAQALAGRPVSEMAALCGIPDWQLRDIVYKRSKRPQPEILQAISRGLGIPYPTLALAAYGIIDTGPRVEPQAETQGRDNPAEPNHQSGPAEDAPCADPEPGRKRRLATASTSS